MEVGHDKRGMGDLIVALARVHFVDHKMHELEQKELLTRNVDGWRFLSLPVCLLSQSPESSSSPTPSSPPPPAPTPASGSRKQPPPVRAQSAGGIDSRHQPVTGPSFSSGVAELYARQQRQKQQRKMAIALCSSN